MADKTMSTGSSVEKLLALHCAPALAGVKPSNLFTLHFSEGKPEARELREAADGLRACGVRMEILCECERYALVFVYREELLAAAMGAEAEDFLAGYGYRRGLTLAEKIARLRSRLGKCGEFPHEIGIFLGYPVEDVRGFIANEGRNFKACGTWKVYGDGERAAGLFESYRRCTEYFCSMVERGARIVQLAELCGGPAQ